jgi:hypothetical protein
MASERLAAELRSEAGGRRKSWLLRAMRGGAAAGLLALITASTGAAQTAPAAPKTLPDTTIAPAGGEPLAPAPAGETEGPDISAPSALESAPTPAPLPTHHHRVHNTVPMRPATYKGPVEAGHGLLQLKADSWAYALPAKSAHRIERVHAGKFVNVTGSTVHYLRVRLKSGATAYVPMTAVELARPVDKVFRLTRDSPVLSSPNHASKKLAEVHNGHDIHVIGSSINYLKIRMKDGLEGFVAMTAAE